MSGPDQPMQPDGGQPANAAQQQPAIAEQPAAAVPPQQQQLKHLQAQISSQPPRMRDLKLPEPRTYRGTRDSIPIREWIRDVEEIFIMGSIPMNHHSSIVYAAHY